MGWWRWCIRWNTIYQLASIRIREHLTCFNMHKGIFFNTNEGWTQSVTFLTHLLPPYAVNSFYVNLLPASCLICEGQKCNLPSLSLLFSQYRVCRDLLHVAGSFRRAPMTTPDPFKMELVIYYRKFMLVILKGAALVLDAVLKVPTASGTGVPNHWATNEYQSLAW